MSYHFSTLRAAQATAILLKLSPNHSMPYMKLVTLLYIADRESIRDTGSPITGDTYVAMPD